MIIFDMPFTDIALHLGIRSSNQSADVGISSMQLHTWQSRGCKLQDVKNLLIGLYTPIGIYL